MFFVLVLNLRHSGGGSQFSEVVSDSPEKLMTKAEQLTMEQFGTLLVWKRTEYVDGENPSWESRPFTHYGTEMYYRIRAIEKI